MTFPRPEKPVKPRNSASLLLIRESRKGPEILMGQRAKKSRFLPDQYVFPGGALDQADQSHGLALTRIQQKRMGHVSDPGAEALARAAVRELEEEAGLKPTTPAIGSKLRYLGRAITPSVSPVRFHARFFWTEADHFKGRLGGDGELINLGWFTLDQAESLPIIDVTEYMLRLLHKTLDAGKTQPPMLYCYRNERPVPKIDKKVAASGAI